MKFWNRSAARSINSAIDSFANRVSAKMDKMNGNLKSTGVHIFRPQIMGVRAGLPWMFMIFCSAVILCSGCSKSPATGDSDSTESQLTAKDATPPRSSDDVVRSFALAMLTKDRAGIEKEIIPTVGADILWTGNPVPEEKQQRLKAEMALVTIKEFKVGDTYYLSRSRKITVTDKLVGPDRKLAVPVIGGQALPVPFVLKRINGVWKIDPSSLIAARQAGQRSR